MEKSKTDLRFKIYDSYFADCLSAERAGRRNLSNGFIPLEKNRCKRLKSRQETQRSLTGFTLIETLVSVGILALIIGASVTLGNLATRGTVLGIDRTQAYNLAQEANELIREIRDTAWIDANSNTNWSSILSVSPGSYKLSYVFDAPSNNYLWRIDSGAESITLDKTVYKRSIFIENVDWYKNQTGIDSSRIKKIRTLVEWTEFGRPFRLELDSYITDWRKEI